MIWNEKNLCLKTPCLIEIESMKNYMMVKLSSYGVMKYSYNVDGEIPTSGLVRSSEKLERLFHVNHWRKLPITVMWNISLKS